MKNSTIYIGAIVLGIIALIVGILYYTNALGNHPARAYAGLGVGAVLVIIGIVGIVVGRRRL